MVLLRSLFREHCLLAQVIRSRCVLLSCGNRWASSSKPEDAQDLTFLQEDETEMAERLAAREIEIEKKRNKSSLLEGDYNKQHDKPPYLEPIKEHHHYLLYKRRMYGKYGSESNINPSILWPSKKELANMKEYESVAYPFTIHELMAKVKQKREEEEERIQKRKEEILEKMKVLDNKMQDFHNKMAKKLEAENAAKAKKDQLVEEVRRHFGFKLDPKDTRIQEALAMKEKAEQKARKDKKKAMKAERSQAALAKKMAEEFGEDVLKGKKDKDKDTKTED